MSDALQRFRQWLAELDGVDVVELASFSSELRRATPNGQCSDPNVLRTWLANASVAQLTSLAREAVDSAGKLLARQRGVEREAIERANEDELSTLLQPLGQVIGRFVVYGLLLSHEPGSPRAICYQNVLDSLTGVEQLQHSNRESGADAGDQDPGARRDADIAAVTAIESEVAELRRQASALAEQLAAAADAVRDGRDVSFLLPLIGDHSERRQVVVTRLGELVPTEPGGGFAEFEAVTGALRAQLEVQARLAAAERDAKLAKQIELVTELLDTAVDDTDRARYTEHLAELRSRQREPQMTALESDEATAPPSSPRWPVDPDVHADALDLVPGLPDTDGSTDAAVDEDPAVPVKADGAFTVDPSDPLGVTGVTAVLGDPSPGPGNAALLPPDPEPEPEPILLPAATADSAIGPWGEGDPPLAVLLASQGRLSEAYWVTATSAELDHRAEVLRFAAAVYGGQPQAKFDIDPQAFDGDHDATVLALTCLLRAALVNGWWHVQPGGFRGCALPEPWAQLVDAAIEAVRHGYRPGSGTVNVLAADGIDGARTDLRGRAAALLDGLPRRKTKYQRATRVLLRLTEPDQRLALALKRVIDWSDGKADHQALAEVSAWFEDNAVQSMVARADAAVSTPKQAREPIVAGAQRALQRAIDEVAAVVDEAIVVASRKRVQPSADTAAAAALARAIADVAGEPLPATMAGAGLGLLRRWLTDHDEPAANVVAYLGEAAGAGRPSADVLLPLPDLPRAEAGVPAADATAAEIFARLREPLDLGTALTAYCDRGDLRSARRMVELHEAGYWPDAVGGADLRGAFDSAVARWTTEYRRRHMEATELFARVRLQNLLEPDVQSAIGGRLEALAPPAGDGVDVALADLAVLTADIEDRERTGIDALRAHLATAGTADADRERIEALLDSGDAITAAEFVSFIRAGKPLPLHEPDEDRDLPSFLRMLDTGFAKASGDLQPSTSAREWAGWAAGGRELTAAGTSGLDAWHGFIEVENTRRDLTEQLVRRILRTLGLNPHRFREDRNARRLRGYRQLFVGATPADGSYVAALGSSASEYTVTVVLESRGRDGAVLDGIGPDDAGRPNLVLCRYPLDSAARRRLAARSAETHVNAVIVDPAAFGWIAATAPGSWLATQRITLPWTTFNPYTPFVAGLVPPEVFVGRDTQLKAVAEPGGGLFVYGGRQLGKSALLRRVEATFGNGRPEQRHAIYLDLKGRGIGEAEPAERIWRELTVELKRRGVLADRVSDNAGVDVVVTEVRKWLQADPDRLVLVLADEADAFLTADSRNVATASGIAQFPNVLRLKELMESTERHFKIVFAGLHQVQRFGHLSNVPLVHGGPEIEIGPLDPMDARRLVVRPMAALGYRFERPELVWRLLSATNYQASLIQIFCDELLRAMHGRRTASASYPAAITEADVAAVAGSDTVRRLIAERIRITINLDDRYRVLTLVVAWCSLQDRFSTDYAPQDLLDLARNSWPAGFDGLTASDVSIYLDEMVGLGLLTRMSGRRRYAMRSPNVVHILGTRDELEAELEQTDFDPPYEYNPREARRLLFKDASGERRSPLTDGQLAEIFERSVSIVSGSYALGADRVAYTVQQCGETRGYQCKVTKSGAELSRAITALSNSGNTRRMIVADLRGRSVDEVEAAYTKLARLQNPMTSVVLADPPVTAVVLGRTGAEPVQLVRWTAESVRSWPECPFTLPAARKRLVEATGGWPLLVETAIAGVVTNGATWDSALREVEASTADRDKASRQLVDAGLDDSMVTRVRPWLEFFEVGDYAPRPDLDAPWGDDPAGTDGLLRELELLDILDQGEQGVGLDRVIHRCLLTVSGDT